MSSPEYLLQYLHNAGIVFHRPGLFRDSIVLDQGWALDAIYAVFNREKCYRELKRLRGRFTRPLLELLVWGGYPEPEQRLFLDMMLSCGVCFVHRGERPGRRDDDTEYIAPDLLPERDAVQAELDGRWDAALPAESVTFEYEMLHPGLVRGLICEIGGAAGVDALYWRGGVCVYETRTRSHALIEQQMTDTWHGRLIVQTQGGQAAALRDQLADWIEQRNNRNGLRAKRIGPAGASRSSDLAAQDRFSGAGTEGEGDTATRLPGTYGPAPVAATEYFVSYAWGDATPEGQQREAIVDRLCTAATSRGITLQRDKTVLRTGDRITAFPGNGGKAGFFNAFGFTEGEWGVLRDALRAHAGMHPVVKMAPSAWGMKYELRCSLPSPDGRQPLHPLDLGHRRDMPGSTPGDGLRLSLTVAR